VPRHTAKFHLDRLVKDGLLDVEYRRLSGRQGPGAGRPAKLYRRVAQDVAVSLPERRYLLAGEILARAVDDLQREDEQQIPPEVARSAQESGRRVAAAAKEAGAVDHEAIVDSPVEVVAQVLAVHGYEPRAEEDAVVLANCPFDELSSEHTQLVCGMNFEFIGAVSRELGCDVDVRLEPDEGRCCVTLRP
jgi:predicted ArsR family transcriptional regulator